MVAEAKGTPGSQEAFTVQPARGTHDILPTETDAWQHVERLAADVFKTAGYGEIRLPIFESTELFKRGVGETTDIVNKEMYTFSDKSDRSLTLRPEGTAGVVRAYLNGGMSRWTQPVKLWYAGPMFRYESIKAGRQRQFHQIGLEAFGSAGPLIDAEVILVAHAFLKQAGIGDLELQVNSIGCSHCRPAYREALKEHLRPHLPELCQDCRDRFERNPLRMLDCKVKADQAHYTDVPVSLNYLCEECKTHWDDLNALLNALELKPVFNQRMVRGLDYYTKTVFEFVTADERLGVSSTICAGGRYDNLVEMFGGQPTPAVGWALGVERLLTLLGPRPRSRPDVFVVSTNQMEAIKLTSMMRQAGIICEMDYPARGSQPRNFSKQLQQANKAGARWTVIAGEEELAAGQVTLKDMEAGSQNRLSTTELCATLKNELAK